MAKKKKSDGFDIGEVIDVDLHSVTRNKFLNYAVSVITSRALPDVRDGLKPVQRRILYAMYRDLKLTPEKKTLKCAKIVGQVLGNYHPHGDSAVYETLVRMAQPWSLRYPLIEGQGNFGSIDGDGAAAYRYTEAKLQKVAVPFLEEITKDTVDFRPNFDDSADEPTVLPSRIPQLLVNGCTGIAVGVATNIPPHNLNEVVDAATYLIDNPEADTAKLLTKIKGPDFPTGGVVVEPQENMALAYRTGRGAFRLRCLWNTEDLGRGQWQIVVTEIPYQVQKSKLIEKLAELIQTKKVPILADVRDESADDIRLILEPKSKNVDPQLLMGALFRNTDLEVRFSLNMNVLIDGVTPKVCSLKEVLRAFLDHRRDVLQRRSRHRLDKIDHRLEVLEGFIIAFLNLDRVIDIIRYDDDPKAALMAENWGVKHARAATEADYRSPLPASGEGELSEVQAEAILNMRLRSLRRLEEIELVKERDALMEERANLEDLLADEGLQWARIAEELRETRKKFGKDYERGSRLSQFAEATEAEEVPLEAMIEREPITVVCSQMGWVRAMTGHIDLNRELKFKDGDGPRFIFHAETTDKLLVFASTGRFYTVQASNLPGGRGMGEPLRLMVDLPNEAEIVDLFIHKPGQKLLVASSEGNGFAVNEDEILAQTRTGKQVLNVGKDARAQLVRPIAGDHVAIVSLNGKFLVFPTSELPEMARGKGVRLQKYNMARGRQGTLELDGGLSDITTFNWSEGLSWEMGGGKTRHEPDLTEWLGKRAGVGKKPPYGFPRNFRFS
mgnify:CR=1 FL=1